MSKATGIVEAMSSKDVNTKWGTKPTYSFKVAGQWYKTGFKRPVFTEGQTIEFDYATGRYGNEVDPAKVVIMAGSPVVSLGITGGSSGYVASTTPSIVPKSTTAPFTRPFPVPALSGERAIVRQNALTNAREVVQWLRTDAKADETDEVAEEIIRLARRFELYTTGDEDAEIAAKESNEEH